MKRGEAGDGKIISPRGTLSRRGPFVEGRRKGSEEIGLRSAVHVALGTERGLMSRKNKKA